MGAKRPKANANSWPADRRLLAIKMLKRMFDGHESNGMARPRPQGMTAAAPAAADGPATAGQRFPSNFRPSQDVDFTASPSAMRARRSAIAPASSKASMPWRNSTLERSAPWPSSR